MLTKHSARTVRRPCKYCGSTALYWAKDSETGRFVLISAGLVTRQIPVGGYVDGLYRHNCRNIEDGEDLAVEASEVDSPVIEDAPKPEPTVKAAEGNGDVQGALQTILDAVNRPAIDENKVRDIVNAVLSETDRPTRTVVIKDAETVEVDGLTHTVLADVVESVQDGPVLMVGPAGTGKSTIARQVSQALGLSHERFFALPLSPTMTTSQLFGYMDGHGNYVRTVFRQWFEHGGLFHFDEFDNSNASIITSLNEALAMRAGDTLAFPDGMIAKAEGCFAIASGNTYGTGPDRIYVGRQQLDAATLDRFYVIDVDYDEALELNACVATGCDAGKRQEILSTVRALRRKANADKLPLIFGQRSSIMACRLAARGASAEACMARAIRRGTSDVNWDRLGAPVLAF